MSVRTSASSFDDMAAYETTVVSNASPYAAFTYLSDLQKLPEWDPAFASVEAPQMIESGATFDAVAAFYGRRIPLEVEVTELEPGESFSLKATGKRIEIDYRVVVDARPTGCAITVSTTAKLSGLLRPLDGGLNAALESTERRLSKALQKRLVSV